MSGSLKFCLYTKDLKLRKEEEKKEKGQEGSYIYTGPARESLPETGLGRRRG
jgi:hypothetical protein